MTPKLARLEELARKATPGPYHIGHVSEIEPGTVDIDGSDGICVCEAYSNNSIGYLCAASPDVILELINKLKVAREALLWEKHRCGMLHGPLRKALEELERE